MLRVHMLRADVDMTGPGLDWISPERRMRKHKAEFLIWLKCKRGRVKKKASGIVLRDWNCERLV